MNGPQRAFFPNSYPQTLGAQLSSEGSACRAPCACGTTYRDPVGGTYNIITYAGADPGPDHRRRLSLLRLEQMTSRPPASPDGRPGQVHQGARCQLPLTTYHLPRAADTARCMLQTRAHDPMRRARKATGAFPTPSSR